MKVEPKVVNDGILLSATNDVAPRNQMAPTASEHRRQNLVTTLY